MRNILLIAFFLIVNCLYTQAQDYPKLIDKVEAIVGDKMVLLSDVQTQYQQIYQQNKGKVPDNLACSILNDIMTQKLLIIQAGIDSIDISEDDVNTELDKRIRYFTNLIGSTDKLEAYYGKSILQIKDEFRDEIRNQLLAQKEQTSIIKDIKVTPAEVQQFFNKIPSDSLPFFNASVQVGQIVIYPKVGKELKELAYQTIADLRTRIINGESFSKLASVYSEDPGSRDNGGELGFQNRTDLDPTFAAAAFALKNPGDISDVIESKFGYHIIQLIERRGERINVRHILIKPKTSSFDLDRAKIICDSVRHLIMSDSITFGQAAAKFSEDDNTKNNSGMLVNGQSGTTTFEMSDMDKDIYFVIDSMKVGEISPPELYTDPAGKQGYRLLYLKTQTKPHKANLNDDYDKIEQMALSQEQGKFLDDWIKSKVQGTYIYIATDYKDCFLMKHWLM
jgi:peptidyl-prolyl cis-trans isomerase SurA